MMRSAGQFEAAGVAASQAQVQGPFTVTLKDNTKKIDGSGGSGQDAETSGCDVNLVEDLRTVWP